MALYPVSHCSCCYFSEFCVWGWRGRQKYLRVCRPRPNHRHAAGNRPLSPALSQKEREMLVITQMTHRRHSYIFFWCLKPSSHVQLHNSKITFTVMSTADVDSVTNSNLCFTPIFMYSICALNLYYIYFYFNRKCHVITRDFLFY